MHSKTTVMYLQNFIFSFLKIRIFLKNIIDHRLITKDDYNFNIPSIQTTLRNPDNPIIQAIDYAIDFLTKFIFKVDDDEKTMESKTENNDDTDNNTIKYIGGVDISHGSIDEDVACAGLIVMEYPSLKQVYHKFKMIKYTKPYIAGFLAFREVEFLVDIINEIKNDTENKKYLPDIILVDGNGILHHRGFGLASHLGVLCGIPTIGIGKNLLMIDGLDRKLIKKQCDKCLVKKGDYIELIGDTKDIVHGVALRCGTQGKNAMFVSIGHRVSLENAIKVTLLTSIHKLPEPIRFADQGTREYIRQYETELKAKEMGSTLFKKGVLSWL